MRSASTQVDESRPVRLSRTTIAKRARIVPEWTVAKKARTDTPVSGGELKLGLRWDSANWSCSYDSLLTVLWNIRVDVGSAWMEILPTDNILARQLTTRFMELPIFNSSLEQVRDYVRDSLSMVDATMFPRYGPKMASVTDFALALLEYAHPIGRSHVRCLACGTVGERPSLLSSNMLWYVLPEHAPLSDTNSAPSVQGVVDRLLTNTYTCRCLSCGCDTPITTTFDTSPGLLILDVSNAGNIRPDLSLFLNVNCVRKRLSFSGAIYHGNDHFTSRYVDRVGAAWYHDGAHTGQHCIHESINVNLLDVRCASGRSATHYIYALIEEELS
ncbi:hypothetical protein BC628DRAFT_1318233 [Trametes gibbosa]|nr:hypothetical protein BC628DRAFT_1332908 [Trametes gibbosa]KAI0827365.1 hypothetical protein BC628DRAFT_1318233 [Trametes gibbosa]